MKVQLSLSDKNEVENRYYIDPAVDIGFFSPSEEASPTAVLLRLTLSNNPNDSMVLTIDSPEALDFLIDSLKGAKQVVWPKGTK
jgi:hypothetical protein